MLHSPSGKWSAAQILEHLALAFGGTARAFRKAAKEGRNLGGHPTLADRLRVFVVTQVGYFPKGRKSPEVVLPTGTLQGSEALRVIHENLAAMDDAYADCRRKLPKGRVADHPVLGPLRLEEWPRFHLAHTRHHMKQIERIKQRSSAASA